MILYFVLIYWRALKMFIFTWSSLISMISAMSLYDFSSKSLSCIAVRCFSGSAFIRLLTTCKRYFSCILS